MIGTPVLAAKVAAAKPALARRNTTVKAAASSSESINRRAAVAGVLAVFAAPAANAFSLPSLPSFGGDAEPKEEKPKVTPQPRGETKRVRKTEKKSTKKDPYTSPSSGGLGNNKAPRAYLKVQQAEIAKAYGLDSLPGQ